MNVRSSITAMTAPLVAAALLTTTSVHANDPPQVAIDNLQSGSLVYNGPVQISGVAADSDGISVIYGTIQSRSNQMFYTTDGKFVSNPAQLPFKFAKNTAKTTWSTPPMRVPAGDYIFRMRIEDGKKLRTEIIAANMTVRSGAAAVAEPAQPKPAAQAAQQPAAKPAGAMAANGMPYCSNPGMDADKDGYGWENEKSCVVAGTKADTHPNCASAASDPDGDGYGWENERSCIVVTRCESANSDPDGDGWGWENDKSCVVVKTSGTHPQCASADSDPDGDGYGWENNATCLVAK